MQEWFPHTGYQRYRRNASPQIKEKIYKKIEIEFLKIPKSSTTESQKCLQKVPGSDRVSPVCEHYGSLETY